MVSSPPNHPGDTIPLDVERYPVAPPELELEQVHVFLRHGERTPVGVRLAQPPASIPEHWMLCKTGRLFRAAVASSTGQSVEEEGLRVRRVVERADGNVVEGECMLGELTDVGRASTYNFGSALRKLYVDKLGFLPDTIEDASLVYFRSTNMPRTIESLQQAVHGLYPSQKYAESLSARILLRNGKDENLIGNEFACKRLQTLSIGFAQAAAAAFNPALEPLDKKLSQYIGGNPIRIDGKPRASGILDTIRAAQAHNIKVPPEFEDKHVVDTLEHAVVQEWFAGYKTEEFRRLAMGRILHDLSAKMGKRAEKGEGEKLLLYATHDTGLAGMCQTLDVFDDKWPAFTGYITLELFKRNSSSLPTVSYLRSLWSSISPFSSTPSEHYVRMRYQNRTLPLPLCAEEGKHLPGSPEFCTLAAFRERVAELTPKDWEEECRA